MKLDIGVLCLGTFFDIAPFFLGIRVVLLVVFDILCEGMVML